MSTLYLCTFMAVSSWTFLWKRNVSDKSCRGKQNKFYVQSFFCEYSVFYEIVWDIYFRARVATYGNTIRRFSGRITKTTKTNSEYVIFTAYPWATNVTRIRLNVTLLRASCFLACHGPAAFCLLCITICSAFSVYRRMWSDIKGVTELPDMFGHCSMKCGQ
jgi:hypothetical protein